MAASTSTIFIFSLSTFTDNGYFFLLLFIFFIVIPLFRVGWRAWQLHRQWRRATEDLRSAFGGTAGQQRRPADNPAPKRRKKKIDPEVGEYVAFEEIKSEATASYTTDGKTSSFRAESQVEDAVWEEIK